MGLIGSRASCMFSTLHAFPPVPDVANLGCLILVIYYKTSRKIKHQMFRETVFEKVVLESFHKENLF